MNQGIIKKKEVAGGGGGEEKKDESEKVDPKKNVEEKLKMWLGFQKDKKEFEKVIEKDKEGGKKEEAGFSKSVNLDTPDFAEGE